MAIDAEGEGFKYTYKLSSGMSNVRGGVKVLNDLEYPDEIISGTREIIDDLNI
jgi:DNA mismatch repair ATPase MutS